VIAEDGHEFVRSFFDKLITTKKVDGYFDIAGKLSEQESVSVRFFVALTHQACAPHYELIRNLKENMATNVGIIRYRYRCREYLKDALGGDDYEVCKSSPVSIGITRRYDRKEFLEEVGTQMKRKFNELRLTYWPKARPRMAQMKLGHRDFHLEAYMYRDRLSLSLDVEPKKKRVKDSFIRELRGLSRLKREVKGLRLKKHGSKGKWARIGLEIPNPTLDDHTVRASVKALTRIYVALKPQVDSFAD